LEPNKTANLKTLVLGASVKPERYSHRAVLQLRAHGHEVVAVGTEKGRVGDVEIGVDFPPPKSIHTVTLYLNPSRQASICEQVIALRPQRVIFNPGTENPAFAQRLKEAGITTEEACTLVLLSIGQYEAMPNA
jgi:predicted CoA-binding protein